jgi:hypothetical protein
VLAGSGRAELQLQHVELRTMRAAAAAAGAGRLQRGAQLHDVCGLNCRWRCVQRRDRTNVFGRRHVSVDTLQLPATAFHAVSPKFAGVLVQWSECAGRRHALLCCRLRAVYCATNVVSVR